ncbi:hypothetical protein [Mesoflavibacter sp. CH_XMU1422-2]|uniref:hypothetical protein n=1 Tax=Mesoflavibacter sp. CH_XMU1422-2 TaxID=3107770 RepID=UPI00300B4625
MKKYLILLILISNFCFGQSESRQNFVITLNVPDYERNNNESFKKIATENKIKRIKFYEEKELVTDLIFDKEGNIIEATDKSNKVISKTKFEFDKQNRLTKISFFTPNGDFKYGYEYKFDGPYKTEFEIGDTIPKRRTIELKDENITINSDYNEKKEWELSSVTFLNKDKSYDRELRYNDNGLYSEFKYYYNPKLKKGGTREIKYFKGIKLSEEEYSAYKTDEKGNRIENFNPNNLETISTRKYNENNQVLETKYYTKSEYFEYGANGLVKTKTIEDRNGTTVLNFFYDNSLPKKIEKVNGDNKLTFKYEYEYFK